MVYRDTYPVRESDIDDLADHLWSSDLVRTSLSGLVSVLPESKKIQVSKDNLLAFLRDFPYWSLDAIANEISSVERALIQFGIFENHDTAAVENRGKAVFFHNILQTGFGRKNMLTILCDEIDGFEYVDSPPVFRKSKMPYPIFFNHKGDQGKHYEFYSSREFCKVLDPFIRRDFYRPIQIESVVNLVEGDSISLLEGGIDSLVSSISWKCEPVDESGVNAFDGESYRKIIAGVPFYSLSIPERYCEAFRELTDQDPDFLVSILTTKGYERTPFRQARLESLELLAYEALDKIYPLLCRVFGEK